MYETPTSIFGAPPDTDEHFRQILNWMGHTRPGFSSAHEGLAILDQAIGELKFHVWTPPAERDVSAMKESALVLAALAFKLADEVCK